MVNFSSLWAKKRCQVCKDSVRKMQICANSPYFMQTNTRLKKRMVSTSSKTHIHPLVKPAILKTGFYNQQLPLRGHKAWLDIWGFKCFLKSFQIPI